jgi:hypothetical protein
MSSSFALLSEAWGTPESPYILPVSRPPAQMAGNASFVVGGESVANVSKVSSMSEVDRDAYVRQYIAEVHKKKGARGVCRLVGMKTCRDIRNAYLFDFSRDEVLISILSVLVLVLAIRLMSK